MYLIALVKNRGDLSNLAAAVRVVVDWQLLDDGLKKKIEQSRSSFILNGRNRVTGDTGESERVKGVLSETGKGEFLIEGREQAANTRFGKY